MSYLHCLVTVSSEINDQKKVGGETEAKGGIRSREICCYMCLGEVYLSSCGNDRRQYQRKVGRKSDEKGEYLEKCLERKSKKGNTKAM